MLNVPPPVTRAIPLDDIAHKEGIGGIDGRHSVGQSALNPGLLTGLTRYGVDWTHSPQCSDGTRNRRRKDGKPEAMRLKKRECLYDPKQTRVG